MCACVFVFVVVYLLRERDRLSDLYAHVDTVCAECDKSYIFSALHSDCGM